MARPIDVRVTWIDEDPLAPMPGSVVVPPRPVPVDIARAIEAKAAELEAAERVLERKAVTLGVPSRRPVILGLEGAADLWDMDRVVREGFERNTTLYRIIDLYATEQSRLKFRFMRGEETDQQEILDDHPLYRLLNRRPNPHETSTVFRHRLSSLMFLSKKGVFIEVGKNRAGDPNRLDHMHPARTWPVPSSDGSYLSHFEYTMLDGTVRELDPTRVLWIRYPHPTDPFSGSTPLEAAGISVELDHLSRVYNISYLKNDGRPGTVIGVDSDVLTDEEADRIERKLAPGAHYAGQTVVLATGPGGLRVVDTSARPRDMAYKEASENAKQEIMDALGVGPSMLGSAAGKSRDEAEQEEYNWYTKPFASHLALIAEAFADFVDEREGWQPGFDTSKVEVLELRLRKVRQEAREEVTLGTRSIDDYRALANLPRMETPQTRALWISPAKAPIPARPEDAAALGLAVADENAPGAPGAGGPGGLGPDGTQMQPSGDLPDAYAAVQRAQGELAGPSRSPEDVVAAAFAEVEGAASAAESAVNAASSSGGTLPGAAEAAVARAAQEGKAAEVIDDGGEEEAARAELAIKAALDAWWARQLGVLEARLRSPKTRRGTRFWEPAPPDGEEVAVDARRVVRPEQWSEEVVETILPIAQVAAAEAGAAVLESLTLSGYFADARPARQLAGRASATTTMEAARVASEIVAVFLERVVDRIEVVMATAGEIEDVVHDLQRFYADQTPDVTDRVAGAVAFSVVNAARGSVAATVADGGYVTKEWLSAQDASVRDAHRALNRMIVPIDEPFTVDGAQLRWPRDPAAPLRLTAQCRCLLRLRFAPGVYEIR